MKKVRRMEASNNFGPEQQKVRMTSPRNQSTNDPNIEITSNI